MTLVGLSGISEALREAALSLAANECQVFFTVTLPLAMNSIAAGAVFAFATSMDDVAIGLFLSDLNTYTLPVAQSSKTVVAAMIAVVPKKRTASAVRLRSTGFGFGDRLRAGRHYCVECLFFDEHLTLRSVQGMSPIWT
ncbi:ABC transporter permease [Bradyrhizobium sp. CCBAU 11430]|uniref:ABC transporter permease n=1 Tax=Bradyrhizobium sp. CCBAU 11430 TaxID=1630881 RepID=UPI003FA42F43